MCIGIINNFNYYEKYNECVGSDQMPIYEIFQNKSQCSTQLWKNILWLYYKTFFLVMMLLMDELKEWKNSFLSLRTCYVKEVILLLSYAVIYSVVGGHNFAICDQTVTLHNSCNITFGASLFSKIYYAEITP